MDAAEMCPLGFKPQEIAYRLPKRNMEMGEWKRVVVKSEKAFDAKISKLQEQGADIEVRDAE